MEAPGLAGGGIMRPLSDHEESRPAGEGAAGAPPPSGPGPQGSLQAPAAAPALPAAPAPLPRPRAATFLLALLGLLPVGLAAQALQPGLGLLWTQLFAFALPAAALAAQAGLAPGPFLRLAPAPPRALGLALLVGAAALVVGGALQSLWALALPEGLLRTFDVARIFRRPPWEQALLVAAATTLAPVCEELAFRGHLLTALGLRRGPAAAIAASAAAFAAMHLDPVRLPGLAFLGALYAWLTWRSGSIYPAVLAHAVNNAAATALALGGGAEDQALPSAAGATAALVAGLLVLGPAALAFHRWLPPAPPFQAALAPGRGAAGRLPRWALAAGWAGVVALAVIAVAPRR